MSLETCKIMVNFEVNELDRLIYDYEPLLSSIKLRAPDKVELIALASILHSFYNGVEKIFSIIAKHFDSKVPSGVKWHNDLLLQMSSETLNRRAVISSETLEILNEYKAFRHFFRHSYSFQLNWDQFEHLCLNLSVDWSKIKQEISIYS